MSSDIYILLVIGNVYNSSFGQLFICVCLVVHFIHRPIKL